MEGDSSTGAGAGAGGQQFQDWELLQNSNSDSDLGNSENSVENQKKFEEIEGDYSEGMIRADYFAVDNENRYVNTSVVVSEEGSVEPDNPSWIDPGSESRNLRLNPGEFWSDSGSDQSDDRKFGDFDERNELGIIENVKNEAKGIGEKGFSSDNLMKFDENMKGQAGFDGVGEIQDIDKDLGRFRSDSVGDGLVSMSFEGGGKENEVTFGDHVEKQDESEDCGESVVGNGLVEENLSVVVEEMAAEMKSVGDEEKKQLAWWKVPFEVLKYCVLKVNPVWSFSMAAAVMGLVILGRRLYKMKRNTRSLQMKVTFHDKKVSQFMSRAARLNEAFSVVRRVPILRPALPVPGANPWPAMSLR